MLLELNVSSLSFWYLHSILNQTKSVYPCPFATSIEPGHSLHIRTVWPCSILLDDPTSSSMNINMNIILHCTEILSCNSHLGNKSFRDKLVSSRHTAETKLLPFKWHKNTIKKLEWKKKTTKTKRNIYVSDINKDDLDYINKSVKMEQEKNKRVLIISIWRCESKKV